MLRLVNFTGATNILTGRATISVKVPGTFAGLNPGSPTFSGRFIQKVLVFFGNSMPGDLVKNISVVDTDGVIPVGQRGAFPNYPEIGTRNDPSIAAANQGLYLNALAPTEFSPPTGQQAVPSGLYLSADFQKGGIVLNDTVYVNVYWDDGM